MANALNAGSIGNIQELLEQKDEENTKLRVRVAELEDMIMKLSEDVKSLIAESELAKRTRKRTPKREEEDNKPAKRVKREHNAVKPLSPSSSGKRMSAAPLEDHPIAESANVRAASEDIVDTILKPDNDDDDPIPASRGPPREVSEVITFIDAPASTRPHRGVLKPAPKIKREIIDVDSLPDDSAPQKDEQAFVRKFEVKKDTELVGTSITSRIEKIASRPVQVTLDPELRRTFSRQTFLSSCFGGSPQFMDTSEGGMEVVKPDWKNTQAETDEEDKDNIDGDERANTPVEQPPQPAKRRHPRRGRKTSRKNRKGKERRS